MRKRMRSESLSHFAKMTIWQAGAARTASQACDKKLDWSD